MAETPGVSIAEVAASISEEKTLVGSTIKALVATDDLRTEGQKKGTKYFIRELDVNAAVQDKVIKLIKKTPAMGLSAIADACNLSKETARNALRILQKDDRIKMHGTRRMAVYVPADYDLRTLRGRKVKS